VLLDTHGGFGLYLGQLQARGLEPDQAAKVIGYNHGDIVRSSLPGGPRGELEADRKAGESAIKMIRDDPAAISVAVLHNIWGLWLGSSFGDLADTGWSVP